MTYSLKTVFVSLLALFLFALIANPVLAQQPKPPGPFDPIEEDPSLPRVLLLGDSISIGYTLPTRKQLEGEVNLLRPPANCGPTTRGIESLDEWLGEGEWDVIHFNFGLHDLKYMNESGGLVDASEGAQQVPIDQYVENMEKIVLRLKETGAVLIFATTTPVPEGAKGRVVGDSAKYNAAALRVMKEHEVAVDDLYAYCMPRLEEIQREADVHFIPAGSAKLAEQVAEHIRKALAPPEEEE
jgi:hypothetical protein